MDQGEPDSAAARGEDSPDFPGAQWLRGGSPKEILYRLLDHDPFELGARVAGLMEERALLVSERKVALRSLARVAHAALGYHGRPALDEWLRGRMDVSLDEILEEEIQAELEGDLLWQSESSG